ncbi:MAG TPA: aminotransferase class V-fold PLP-dependent enzyme [Longimicrobiales bacterium]|nr:aminotransferase class V-fold PLP-dependent enzyme [Longimicrobiales bacterium]
MANSRRTFLTALAAAFGAGPSLAHWLIRPSSAAASGATSSYPPPGRDSEPYWQAIRQQFLIPADEAFFNTGTLGSPPRPVMDAVASHMTHVARDIAHWDYHPDHEQYFTGYAPELGVREKLASLISADVDEVALTQNATVGMNMLANGLEMEPGDEAVVLRNAHPGGRCGWELREKRHGVRVVFVTLPSEVSEPAQLLALYEQATTPRTRAWAIPHLTSGQGAVLFPVDEMCRRARELGILSLVDGAQTLGHLHIDVRAMDCDAFYSSPHKWLLAPVGCGLLYIRRDAQPRFWTTLASTNWDNHDDGAYRFMQYGTGNLSLLVGLERAIDFHQAIGSEAVEARNITLTRRLREGLAGIPGVTIHSPSHPDMVTGTTIWSLAGVSGGELQDALWSAAKVRVRSSDGGVRQCCHICTTMADVERSVQATRALAAG